MRLSMWRTLSLPPLSNRTQLNLFFLMTPPMLRNSKPDILSPVVQVMHSNCASKVLLIPVKIWWTLTYQMVGELDLFRKSLMKTTKLNWMEKVIKRLQLRRMEQLTKDVGLIRSMRNSWKLWRFMGKIGIKFTFSSELGQVLRLDHMRKNSSINCVKKAGLSRNWYSKHSSMGRLRSSQTSE